MGIFRAQVGGRDRLGSRGRGSRPEEAGGSLWSHKDWTKQCLLSFLFLFFFMEQFFKFLFPPGGGGVGWSSGFGVRKTGFRFCS